MRNANWRRGKTWLLAAFVAITAMTVNGSHEAIRDPTSNDEPLNGTPSRWGEPTAGIVCGVHLPPGEDKCLPATEDLILFFDTKTVLAKSGTVLFSNPYRVFLISVVGPQGRPCPKTRFGEQEMNFVVTWGSGFDDLDPHGIQRYSFHINHLYDMSIPGTYKVSFRRRVRFHGKLLKVTSNQLEIDITQADPLASRYLGVVEPDQ